MEYFFSFIYNKCKHFLLFDTELHVLISYSFASRAMWGLPAALRGGAVAR
jgi:hypothetical protein